MGSKRTAHLWHTAREPNLPLWTTDCCVVKDVPSRYFAHEPDRATLPVPTYRWKKSWHYFFAGGGFGIFNVHEPPNTIVRPCTRAFAEYSS